MIIFNKRYFKNPLLFLRIVIIIFMPVFLIGCVRGRPKQKPPIHIIPDMDSQKKYKPQSESRYFEDGLAMRAPIPGTVAQGMLQEDVQYNFGRDESGEFVAQSPVKITLPNLQRGRERYNIFCAPCHSQTGEGQGILIKKGYLPPPNFHDKRIQDLKDGYIYDVITNGVRNMPSHKHQIAIDDRWAIVNYVRALQRSQNATIDDIPQEIRDTLK
jgi:mono/diheme cytochrome c family protein